MTRFSMFALLGALTASAVSVPAGAQTQLPLPDLRSPVQSDPSAINPAPIVGHGAQTGAIPVPMYHGQPVQTPTPGYGVGGTQVHVPGSGGVRLQSGSGVAAGAGGATAVDAGTSDNRVPANQWNVGAAGSAVQSNTTTTGASAAISRGYYSNGRSLAFTREERITDPIYVMQSDRDGKGVALRYARDTDDNGFDDEEEEYYRGRYDNMSHHDEDAYDDEVSLRGSHRNRRRSMRDLIDLEDQAIYHRKQLIPYMYSKHNGVGLYRPWMYNVKWNYWYGCDFRPFVPGVPDRYSPMMTEYGLYPRGNMPSAQGAMPMQPAAMNAPAMGHAYASAAPVMHSAPVMYGGAMMSAQPAQAAWQQYGNQAYGHGIHPGFDDVSYRPRHAGSYSPYVGPYGFGGRWNYGYGPYNYQWSGGYSGFGRTGSFNYWLPQSGL